MRPSAIVTLSTSKYVGVAKMTVHDMVVFPFVIVALVWFGGDTKIG